MAKLGSRKGGPRRTTVARTPYWREDVGHWVFIPTGATHKQSLEYTDPETNEVTFSQDQYEAKGWVPIYRIPESDKRRDLLPKNWREMAKDHKVPTVLSDGMKAAITGDDKAKANAAA